MLFFVRTIFLLQKEHISNKIIIFLWLNYLHFVVFISFFYLKESLHFCVTASNIIISFTSKNIHCTKTYIVQNFFNFARELPTPFASTFWGLKLSKVKKFNIGQEAYNKRIHFDVFNLIYSNIYFILFESPTSKPVILLLIVGLFIQYEGLNKSMISRMEHRIFPIEK